MVIISLFGKQDDKQVEIKAIREKLSFDAIAIWVALFAVMIGLYVFFNLMKSEDCEADERKRIMKNAKLMSNER
jgi:dipeptide/tripeptide permease